MLGWRGLCWGGQWGTCGQRQAGLAQPGQARPASGRCSRQWPGRRAETVGRTATHAGHFPLDVLEELLLASQEARVLELGVVPLWLDQATLLNVDHLPEAICVQRGQSSAASGLESYPSLQEGPCPGEDRGRPWWVGPCSGNAQHCPPRSPACSGWVVLVSGRLPETPLPLQLRGFRAAWGCMQGQGSTLTHVELPHKASHVAVLEVLGQHLLGKLALVQHVEAVPALLGNVGVTTASPCRGCTPTLGWVSEFSPWTPYSCRRPAGSHLSTAGPFLRAPCQLYSAVLPYKRLRLQTEAAKETAPNFRSSGGRQHNRAQN